MLVNSIRSEWLKFRTTKAFYWVIASFFLVNMFLGWMMGWSLKLKREPDGSWPYGTAPTLTASYAGEFLSSFGMIAVIAGAAMMITGEYRHNYAQVTFFATPARWVVVLAKAIVACVFVAVLCFLGVLATLWAAKIGGGSEISQTLVIFDNEGAKRLMWVFPLSAVLISLMTQGISWLMRNSAGVITLMIVWLLVLESLLMLVPKIGDKIHDYGPFTHLNNFLKDLNGPADFTVMQNLWYFVAWAVGIYIVGLVVAMRRDV